MRAHADLLGLIGNTPLVRLERMENKLDLSARLFAKLEFYNPLRSVKDRIAWAMVKRAMDKKQIKSKTRIVEPTSGNTGIGLAFVCARLEIPLILVMPESVSEERKQVLKALGAALEFTDAAKGMSGAVARAREMIESDPDLLMLDQFSNPANPEIHYRTTAAEIWDRTEGRVDAFVAGVGTGGTITGVARFLGERGGAHIVAVEPKSSAVLSGGKPGSHRIQGIGAGFIPEVLDVSVIDEVIAVGDDEARDMTRLLARVEGMLCGISSGAALFAAAEVAKRDEFRGKSVVTVLPDLGERYLTTGLF